MVKLETYKVSLTWVDSNIQQSWIQLTNDKVLLLALSILNICIWTKMHHYSSSIHYYCFFNKIIQFFFHQNIYSSHTMSNRIDPPLHHQHHLLLPHNNNNNHLNQPFASASLGNYSSLSRGGPTMATASLSAPYSLVPLFTYNQDSNLSRELYLANPYQVRHQVMSNTSNNMPTPPPSLNKDLDNCISKTSIATHV